MQRYALNGCDRSTKKRYRVDRLGRTHWLECKLAAEAESRVTEEVDSDDRPVKDVWRVNMWDNASSRLVVIDNCTVDEALWHDLSIDKTINHQAIYPLRNIIHHTLPAQGLTHQALTAAAVATSSRLKTTTTITNLLLDWNTLREYNSPRKWNLRVFVAKTCQHLPHLLLVRTTKCKQSQVYGVSWPLLPHPSTDRNKTQTWSSLSP